MNHIVKIVVAVLVAALIAVIGLIVISNNAGDKTPEAIATTAPKTEAAAIEATAMPEATQEPVKTTETEVGSVSNEAQKDQKYQAQDTMYEGALAGMTAEEIEKQALAEEESHGTGTESND